MGCTAAQVIARFTPAKSHSSNMQDAGEPTKMCFTGDTKCDGQAEKLSGCFGSRCFAAQVEDLKRFMPQILHIMRPGTQAAAAGNKNVGSASSLAEVFAFAG